MSLTDLLARVEAATGPDRELDGDIALACGAVVDPAERNLMGIVTVPAWWTMPRASCAKWPHRTTPWPLTASIDSALALAERVLPGWAWMLRGSFAKLWEPHGKPPGNDFDAMGRSPALAIIAAILKALIAADTREPTP